MRPWMWLAAAAVLMAGSHQVRAATQPSAGMYQVQGLYTSVTPTGGATDCPTAGNTLSFIFLYPGPAAIGATFYSAIAPGGTAAVQMGAFPKTPAAGARAWAGNVLVSDTTGSKRTVAFAGTFTFDTAAEFLMNVSKWDEPSKTGGACDEVLQLVFIRTGAL